jgi:Secretion system C-terminal sorting domain
MKKIIFTLFYLFIASQIIAQKIIDPNFASAIRQNCATCLDNNNNITEDGQKLRTLTVAIQQITDLTGVAGFGSLQSLNCTNNNISFIPVLPSGLKILLISHNKLTKLENLSVNLAALYCIGNQLKSLPSLPSGLEILDCSYNSLTALVTIPPTLKTLFCSNNQLKNLPELPKTLIGLECGNNNLKNLPELPETLSILSCQNNSELTCLPKLPDSLSYLYIPKGILCLPNKIKKAIIQRVEGIDSKPVNLPICTNIQLALCPPILPERKEADKKITVFPNPTEGILTIQNQGYTIEKVLIYNYLGKLVRQINTSEIDIANLASGWYLFQIYTNEGIFSEKIMRQ